MHYFLEYEKHELHRPVLDFTQGLPTQMEVTEYVFSCANDENGVFNILPRQGVQAQRL
jgi:hypothetical protein